VSADRPRRDPTPADAVSDRSDADGYAVPAAAHRVEAVIERSRFVTSLARADSADAARAFIDAVRAEFPDATHNCWAFLVGPPGTTATIGMSDAGEPHGTAGRPMLDVLLHSGVGDIVAVVTRYFGGTKLGKGGLVRAYGSGVRQALESLPRTLRVERTALRVELAYADIDAVRRLLEELDAVIRHEEYGEAVRYVADVPVARAEALRAGLMDRTAGRARVASDESR
jgi:uncharacterized YigZ family protein